jgi:hypothetical protein
MMAPVFFNCDGSAAEARKRQPFNVDAWLTPMHYVGNNFPCATALGPAIGPMATV